MKVRIVAKDEPISTPRTGEALKLYDDLVALMQNDPDEKMIVDFESVQKGYRIQQRLLTWATEDGYTLFASVVPGTAERHLYLQTKSDKGGAA